MRKIFLLLSYILYSGVLVGQSLTIGDGQTITISDRLILKFPSEPEHEQIGNNTLFIVNDSTYIVNVMVVDMKDNPKFNIRSDQLTAFYRGVIKGTLAAAADSKLLSETTFEVGQYEGREMRYTKDFYGIEDIPITKRILLVDKAVYTFDIWDISKSGQKDLEKSIFDSIMVR